ncbi:uncharacterized protein LOC143200615 [Rhynchophorus ferrugineus]|uniref:uncharacterized protein LOC143200615 n=1 Tax=Rhynchophorus ferrugineus TaxID=354439 RepID=UPI003FCC83A8
MDEFIGYIAKFLSSTVLVRIASYPSFSIEIFLAMIVCVSHFLLIFEINTLVRRTNAKAAQRLRLRQAIKESATSFHSLVTLQATQVFQKKPEPITRMPLYSEPVVATRLPKRLSRPAFGWMLSKGDSILKHNFNDRVEHLLSISPSEYVRRDRERKTREQGLRSCIQSLTSLLEKALNNETLDVQNFSKDQIRQSLNTLRENVESQLNYHLDEFPSASLQSLIARSTAKNALKNSLSPNLISSIYRASNVTFSQCNIDDRLKKVKENKRGSNLSLRSSASLSELYRNTSKESLRQGKLDRRRSITDA